MKVTKEALKKTLKERGYQVEMDTYVRVNYVGTPCYEVEKIPELDISKGNIQCLFFLR